MAALRHGGTMSPTARRHAQRSVLGRTVHGQLQLQLQLQLQMQLQHASAHGRQNAHISVRHALVTSRLPPACHSSNSKGQMSSVLFAPASWSIQSCTVDPAWFRKKNRQRNQEQNLLEHWQSRPQRWGQLDRKNGIDGRVHVHGLHDG